jgi:cobalt-precorrin-5B (C1)-methyltransferase
VPQEMIRRNLQGLLSPDKGAEVTISVPGGKELADKTLNPRLGIVGGISILGTTGIARSMSSDSYKKSFKCQLDVAVALGYRELIFVPGNIGEGIARRILEVEEDQIIQMGNFVGYMLQEASGAGVEKLTLVGHAGKIIKIAAGIFNTKHSIADGRREIITAHAGISGAESRVLKRIYESNTTEDMIDILKQENLLQEVFNRIAQSIKERCQGNYPIKIDVVIVRMDGTVLNSNHLIKLKN